MKPRATPSGTRLRVRTGAVAGREVEGARIARDRDELTLPGVTTVLGVRAATTGECVAAADRDGSRPSSSHASIRPWDGWHPSC